LFGLGSVGGCNADLKTECTGGDGTCDEHVPIVPEVEVGPCLERCNIAEVSGNTGEYPCEVEAVVTICRQCHTGPEPRPNFAPFPLDAYPDSQQLYFGSAIWARMKRQLETDSMPLNQTPLDESQKSAMIDDWICRCAPPRNPDTTCP
jgi:hypothetical protein